MGTDIYFTKRQKLQEQGLRLGAQIVNTPVCRNCGEVADKVPDPPIDVFKNVASMSTPARFIFYGVLFLLFLGVCQEFGEWLG